MYLKYYYEHKGQYVLEDKGVYNYNNLTENKLTLKINMKNIIEIKQINFIFFLFLKLWYSNIQLNNKRFVIIIQNYNDIFSFFENLILIWLPLSSNIELKSLNKNSKTIPTYTLKCLPFLEELEILFEYNDYYYYLLQMNVLTINIDTPNLNLTGKENFLRFLKIPLHFN